MVPLVCPITREPLEQRGDKFVAAASGNTYPIVDNIPVLLPDEAERQRIVNVNWAAPGDNADSRLGFYNANANNQLHARNSAERAHIEQVSSEPRAQGPTLEIGSGGGAMQGIGQPYVALDYGFTALRDYIDAKYQRVCGTAEALPFPDATFGFVFSIDALEHVPRPDLAFAEVDRVLKSGGVAFLKPAWHCRQYTCEGIPVLRYRELNLRQKITKFTLPVRNSVLARGAVMLPRRLSRRLTWAMSGAPPTTLHFGRLKPDYARPLCADSDACSSLDSHEATLFFHSRGYQILSPGPTAKQQILARHVPLIVRKSA